ALPDSLGEQVSEQLVRGLARTSKLDQEIVAFAFARAASMLATKFAPGEKRETWRWSRPLVAAFKEGERPEREATLLALLLDVEPAPFFESLEAELDDVRMREYLEVHEHGGTIWFRKERFEELVRMLAAVQAALHESDAELDLDADQKRALEIATESGYRFR